MHRDFYSFVCYFESTLEAVRVLRKPEREEDRVNVVYLHSFSSIIFLSKFFVLICSVSMVAMFLSRDKPSDLPQLSLYASVHSEDSYEFGTLDDDDCFDDFDLKGKSAAVRSP